MAKIVNKTCSTPISSIVYITDKKVLDNCLACLSRSMPNVEWLYCIHKGENGDKDHTHLLLRTKSDKFNNCDKIRDYFIIDDKGTYCSFFEQTKSLGDWYKYAYHDKEYLDKKHEIKEFYYTEQDIFGSNDLRQLCKENYKYIVQQSNENYYSMIVQGIQNGLSNLEILESLPYLVDCQDYLSALRLINELDKMLRVQANDNIKSLEKCLSAFLSLENSSYKDLEIHNSYRALTNTSSIANLVIEKLANIDLIEFLFNRKK